MPRLLALIVISLTLLGAAQRADAQALSPAERDLRDRALGAAAAFTLPESYTSHLTLSASEESVLDLGPDSGEDRRQRVTLALNLEAQRRFAYGDSPYAEASYALTFRRETDFDALAYTLDASLRYVGASLYVNAAVSDTLGPVDFPPEDWFAVTDPADFPVLAPLDLPAFVVEVVRPEVVPAGTSPDRAATLLSLLPIIAAEATTVTETTFTHTAVEDSGEAVLTHIVMSAGWGAVAGLLEPGGDNRLVALLADALAGEEDLLRIGVLLDPATDNLRGLSYALDLTAAELPLDPAAGITVEQLTVAQQRVEVFSRMGEHFERPPVPSTE